MESDSQNIPWNEIIKKEARGINDVDLGKIQEIGSDSILTKKGIINTKLFEIPKDLVESYDEDIVYFKLTEEEAINLYMRKEVEEDFSIEQPKTTKSDENNENNNLTATNYIDTNKKEEIVIPLMAEELVVTKKELQDEITITKEPIRETKTEQVQLIHEEIEIERRPVNNLSNRIDDTSISEDVHPVESKTEIKIPLKREEAEVTKKPYVKEELVIRKKPVTETRRITEEVTYEQVEEPNNSK
jgi:uncharacterized protein (TIGR02271 family)